ncbi:hypothetical protein Fot_28808 [Forsythia ovata]|uniref:Uncharacterized protein n=1 Tax=Forsythia ovata TaxID=205694 RepID=A0ABD1TQ65_9LAMI
MPSCWYALCHVAKVTRVTTCVLCGISHLKDDVDIVKWSIMCQNNRRHSLPSAAATVTASRHCPPPPPPSAREVKSTLSPIIRHGNPPKPTPFEPHSKGHFMKVPLGLSK